MSAAPGYHALYRAFYMLMRHAPRPVNRWLWRNSETFRRWWGDIRGY